MKVTRKNKKERRRGETSPERVKGMRERERERDMEKENESRSIESIVRRSCARDKSWEKRVGKQERQARLQEERKD